MHSDVAQEGVSMRQFASGGVMVLSRRIGHTVETISSPAEFDLLERESNDSIWEFQSRGMRNGIELGIRNGIGSAHYEDVTVSSCMTDAACDTMREGKGHCYRWDVGQRYGRCFGRKHWRMSMDDNAQLGSISRDCLLRNYSSIAVSLYSIALWR
jgi:hypothetical protein